MTYKTPASGFGLIVIGNEILDGRREDRHVTACRERLSERHVPLTYVFFLPDDPERLVSQIRWAMEQPEPFFCCGGIGATPDDHTRGCAARAAGVELEMHAEGAAMLQDRFGERATPARLEMVRFPQGSTLVPNPVNQVPGFQLRNGYFLPGFPEMAHPMMVWVLDTYYETGEPTEACALLVYGCGEADLAEMMSAFMSDNPAVSFSSLPRMKAGGGELELGIRGPIAAMEGARRDLIARLEARRIRYRPA